VGSVVWPAADAIDHRFGALELVCVDAQRNERARAVQPPFLTGCFAVQDDRVLVIGRARYREGEHVSRLATFDSASGELVAEGELAGRGCAQLIPDDAGRWLAVGAGGVVRICVEPLSAWPVPFEAPEVPVREVRVVGLVEFGQPPDDVAGFEEWQRVRLERVTVNAHRPSSPPAPGGLGVIHAAGTNEPLGLIAPARRGGVVYEQVRLQGSFPETQVAVIFRCPGREGCRYGWRSALWDTAASRARSEPVQREFLEYLDVYLQEDIGTALPQACDADEEGITWLGSQPVSLAEAARRVPYPVLVPTRAPSEHVQCHYQRSRRGQGTGVSILYRSDGGELVLALHEALRPERWLQDAEWKSETIDGVLVEVLDPCEQSAQAWAGGWRVRRQIGHTHVTAGPGADRARLLDAVVEMESVPADDASLVDRPEVAYHRAIEAQQLGDRDAALESFRQAGMSAHPRFGARGWYQAAHILEGSGDLAAAREAYRRASDGDPREPSTAKAAVNLGALLRREGQTDAAQQLWRRVREMEDPIQAALATINLGAVEFHAGNLTAAEALFGEAASAEIPVRSAQARVFLGLTHERRGDLDAARRALALAAQDPDEEWAARARTELDRLTNDHNDPP
jgi:tetratricopeptide (TPR) repeat protein